MRSILIFLIAALGSGCAASDHTRSGDRSPMVVILGVTVIDGTGSAPAHDMAVVIEGDRIRAVARADGFVPAADALLIDGRGKTVIPGLVGMHDHTHVPGDTFTGDVAADLWLAGGVTTVMTAGSASPQEEIALAAKIADGSRSGPQIVPSAPYVTGPGGNGPMEKPADAEAARTFVREWHGKGVTWFKIYRHIEPTIARAIIDEAHRLGAKVTGHLCSLTFAEAAKMGIDGIEHGLVSASDFVGDKQPGQCVSASHLIEGLDLDSAEVRRLIATLVDRGVTITSTLPIIEARFAHRPQADERSLAALTPAARARVMQRTAGLERQGSRWSPGTWDKILKFEQLFAAAGGTLLAGPDFGHHIVPGYGNQRGIELLVESGFPVAIAIRIATFNGAQALGMSDRIGRIAKDFEADMVLLDGDLSQDIGAIRRVETVFVNGKAIDPRPLVARAAGRFGG